MSVIRELQEQLQQTQTAKFVTTMLRDISATRLQAIRAEVATNQAYYRELHELMALVKEYALNQGVNIEIGEYDRIYIAVTSNRRFYGHVNHDVMDAFVETLQADPTAAGYVIGATGGQYWEQEHPETPQTPTFLTPSDSSRALDVPTQVEIRNIVEAVSGYNEVVIVHPQFVNSFVQEAQQTDLTHMPQQEPASKPSVDYIVEPDVPALLRFFRTQVRLVLFRRVVLETRLALTGARLMKMQRARERAKDMERTEQRRIHKQISTVQNMRLLETFTGFVSDRTI